MRVPFINELRGWTNAVGEAADRAVPVEAEVADEYEALAGVLGALSLGAADITYKMIESGTAIGSTDSFIDLVALVITSVGASFFYGKSRESRQAD